MLKEIYAENFALIDKLHQEFDDGLSVLTGETGAGKSVLIDAVGLLLGDRFDQGFIRAGAEKCTVQGVFSSPFPAAALQILSEAGIEADEEDDIIISREANRSGKSTARINYRSVPVSLLKDLSGNLINIHGQAEHTLLCNEAKQTELLDNAADEGIKVCKEELQSLWQEYRQYDRKYAELKASIAAAAEKEDFLRYQIKELKAAALQIGEDDELRLQANRLSQSEKLIEYSSSAHDALSGSKGALEKLDAALSDIRRLSALDNSLDEYAAKLESIYYEAEDIAATIADYASELDIDPAHIEAVQQRLSELEKLKKKYRMDISGLINYWHNCEEELNNIDCADELLLQCNKQKEAAFAAYMAKAELLSAYRKASAIRLSEQITDQLHELYMPNAGFKVDLLPTEPSEDGLEKACFMLAANIGEPFSPLARTASGGELSRVILAIKVILADSDGIPTLIFDEIDTGLGGRAVSAVAKRLSTLAEQQQVLCVTHAPILAAAASHQIFIHKEEIDGRTVIQAQELSYEERVQEISRMLAGEDVSEQTMAQAIEMLNK